MNEGVKSRGEKSMTRVTLFMTGQMEKTQKYLGKFILSNFFLKIEHCCKMFPETGDINNSKK